MRRSAAALPDDARLVSGGANGVNRAIEEAPRERGWFVCLHLPDYAAFGRSAPLRRNSQIVANADIVVAFWDGQSNGTMDVIERTLRAGKPLLIVRPWHAGGSYVAGLVVGRTLRSSDWLGTAPDAVRAA